MAINKKLIHFKTKSVFNQKLANNEILDTSIVFIQDTREIWTHGQFYDCSGGTTTDTSQWITEEELQELLSPIQSSLVNKLEEKDLEGYAKTEDVPTKLSDLTDDLDFITNTEATAAYAPKSLVETVDNQATTISTLATKSELSTGLAGKLDNSAASGFVPTTRKINGVALDEDITITATDPNAATKAELNSLSTNLTSEINKKATSATTLAGYGITDGVNTVDDVQTGTYITDITIEGHTLKTTRGSHTVTGKEVTDALGYTPLQGADITNLASKTDVSNAVTPVSNRVTAIEELIDADSDAVIDKWEEVVTFLDGIGTDNDLEALLAAKANSSTVNALDTRVTNLTTSNIAEGSNLYFTNARAVSALSNTLASYVPTSRTINGKKLTGNITLSASDVGAASTSELNATNTNLATVDAKFANYLPLSGGTMSGGLKINTSTAAYVQYLQNSSIKAEVGWHSNYGVFMKNEASGKFLHVTDAGVPKFDGNTILHSGNVGEYNAGGIKVKQVADTDDLSNYIGSGTGISFYTNDRGEVIGDIGSTSATLVFGHAANRMGRFIYWRNDESNNLYWQSANGSANAWGTKRQIAFTNSNVASAQALKHSNGTVGATVASSGCVDFSGNIALALGKSILDPSGRSIFMLDDNNSPQIGYDTVGSYSTYINGKDVYLCYGSSRTTGLILNTSGNVGIGTTSPAYKLDVAGSFNATSGYIGGNTILHSGNVGSYAITSHQDISGKVDKVSGKGLSTNDFTTTLKNKLEALPTTFAPTNAEANVQADWNEANSSSDAFIKNKPTIPTVPNLSGGSAAETGKYVSGVTVSGHTVTVTKGTLPTIPSKFTGTSATTSGNSGTNFSAAPGGHTHSVTASGSVSSSFSGTAATSGQNSGTNFSAAPGGHTHSVTAGGSVSSSFTGSAVTSGANSGTNFSAAPGGHTHSVTASGTITLTGLAALGVLQLGAVFSGSAVTSGANSGTNTSVSPASHTHSVTAAGSVSSSFTGSAVTSGANSGTNTSVAPAKHTHSVTATGSVSSSFTGSAVTSGANSGTNGSVAPGGHTHTVTATGSIS